MHIEDYIDATYLKTPQNSNLSHSEIKVEIKNFIEESIQEDYKALMLHQSQIKDALKMVTDAESRILIGTVIDFPLGDGGLVQKLSQAKKAMFNGADELDFVIDYKSFKNKNYIKFLEEIHESTKLVLAENRDIKWILETAALTNEEIIKICEMIRDLVLDNFKDKAHKVFLKTSTGFYKTPENISNGATKENLELLLKHGAPLPVKASGGVKTHKQAVEYLKMGVMRLGTSSPIKLLN